MLFLVIFLVSCSGGPIIDKEIDHIFGEWIHERIEYSNTTVYVSSSGNETIYNFISEFHSFTNNLSNYIGEIYYISSGTTNVVSNTWAFDVKNDKLYINTSNTNFVYTINLVAVDSSNVNYLWLMDGVYSISNQSYYFFVSNNIKMYILKKTNIVF